MAGFFSSSSLESKAPASLLAKCGACGLYKQCGSPKLNHVGKGKRKILFIYESPSALDDSTGELLSNSRRDLPLETAIRKCGIDMKEDCWFTTSIICYSKQPATNEQIGYCRPNLIKKINELKPDVIIPLGSSGLQALIPYVWKEYVGRSDRWYGWQIPSQKLNAWICPTYSPAFISHTIQNKDARTKVYLQEFQNQIQAAIELKGKPWTTVPDYRKEINIVQQPDKAAKMIRKMIDRGGTVAFDYETDRLKPDSQASRIVSCSVCWEGKKTIAYPWHGEAIKATGELLRSPLKKIASNLKFEDRWTRRHFGHRVRNWYWDTMLAAHVINNKPAITSIKFQSFVLLGAGSYDDHITKYFRSAKGEEANQIDKIDIKDLLIYNAMDSLLEYKVALKQMDILGYPRP
jgi:uracil-DNA glycosylase family 4